MRTLTLHLVLCCLLLTRVAATPVAYEQVAGRVGQGQSQADPKKTDSQQPVSQPVDGGQKPEFVRLIDGRIVPYGPGLICSDECIQADALALEDNPLPRLSETGGKRWLLALPLPLLFLLLRGDSGGLTIVSDTTRDVTPTPPPAADVPEPATLVLLGLGLAIMARHGFGKRRKTDTDQDV